jgi:hypothetical protein
VREDNGEQNLKSLWVNRRTSALLWVTGDTTEQRPKGLRWSYIRIPRITLVVMYRKDLQRVKRRGMEMN